jgi:methylmalonyl-CoA mutase C-terminal domain/subunit
MAGKIRVVIAKPGLDGHDRGAKIIARALRDAGMEVIYTGLHQTPEQIVETAIQEDADAVGISILSGAHMTLVPRILELLRENGADDVLVVVGGTIPADDAAELKRQGVADVFGPGAPTSDIVDFLRAASAGGQAAAARPENPDAFGGGGAASAGGQAAAARPENHAALGGGGGAVPA